MSNIFIAKKTCRRFRIEKDKQYRYTLNQSGDYVLLQDLRYITYKPVVVKQKVLERYGTFIDN